uniref:FGGY-family carbohydrate kinase n=1 Tax=Pararhizobium sp. IMCC3301 TaxID=3067904 RepID=UPI003531A424
MSDSIDCVLGLDIGTTSTIGILIGLPDRVLAKTSRPVTLSSPKVGWAEENPQDWWSNVTEIIPELLEQSGVPPQAIKAIGVTGMLPALVILDQNDTIIRPAIQQSDGRCGAQVTEIAGEIDEAEFTQTAGNGINQQLIAAKLRWLEQNEPDNFKRIATVFGSYDFINWKLTGQKAIEQNWALEAGFVDLANHELSDDLIALAHCPRACIPDKIRSEKILGHVTHSAMQATGLSVGTPVVGGAADHIASGLAAGVTQPGDMLLKFGGSIDVLIATQTVSPDPRMFLDYHLIPDMFMPNGCMASGGSSLNWFADKFAGGELPAAQKAGLTLHQHLDIISATTPAGADGVQIIPYFLGEKTPIHDTDARGIIHGLSLSHDLRHVWRAMLEGYAYALRHHVEVFAEMGHPARRVLASDGGANSQFWMQICADVLQKPVQLLIGHPGSCLAAAWVAAMGVGLSEDWAGIDRYVTYGELLQPRPETAGLYDKGYQLFRETYTAHRAARKAVDEY